MRIPFASAPCGSGKTYNLIARAYALAQTGQCVIVAQPTRELIDKTAEEELEARTTPPLYRVFHGGTVGEGTVAKALIRFLKDPPDGGRFCRSSRSGRTKPVMS
jgi:superfamily II DNA or RNA helicase